MTNTIPVWYVFSIMSKTKEFKGEKIKEARESKGWSLQELSLQLYERDINLTPMTLSNYENEKTTPDIDNLAGIAQCLGKDLEYFFA